MRPTVPRAILGALLVLTLVACARAPQGGLSPVEFRRTVSGATWELTELDGRTPPEGAGGRRATLIFERDSARAGGFSGCNSYGGSYTLDGATLRFGAIVMTRMACDRGMDLEQQLARALERAEGYELAGGELRLRDANGVVARFRRAGASR
jgi:heat shock protein HslJ